ncbi:MAG: hypothetical protein ROO76_02685 [Terriglobia bacterium]|nr:hypothetical protein [Terriglobia bacterium]
MIMLQGDVGESEWIREGEMQVTSTPPRKGAAALGMTRFGTEISAAALGMTVSGKSNRTARQKPCPFKATSTYDLAKDR